MKARIAVLLLGAGLAGVGAGHARDMAPAPATRDYASACGTCHDKGGFAVRVLTDRRGARHSLIHQRHNLPPEAIRTIVRNGMGAMPAMSRLEVSDAELTRIIAELEPARQRGSAP